MKRYIAIKCYCLIQSSSRILVTNTFPLTLLLLSAVLFLPESPAVIIVPSKLRRSPVLDEDRVATMSGSMVAFKWLPFQYLLQKDNHLSPMNSSGM